MSEFINQFIPTVKSVFSRWNDFDGRAARMEFWTFFLFCIAVNIAIGLIATVSGKSIGDLLSVIFFLLALLPNIAVAIRRMHDQNRSGWWVLLPFVPFVGAVIFLVLCAFRGTEGPNRFGPDPLGQGRAVVESDPIS